MNADEFSQKVKNWFSKSAEASKNAFEKAGDKVQEFSDKSVVRLEKKQLEGKVEEKYKELGKMISTLLENGANISLSTEEDNKALSSIQSEIAKLKSEIKEKEEALK